MKDWHDLSVSSSRRNCHSWMGPLPAEQMGDEKVCVLEESQLHRGETLLLVWTLHGVWISFNKGELRE